MTPPPYCPACLDAWALGKSDTLLPIAFPRGARLHVVCGRALEALRTAPKRSEWTGWAA